MSSPDHDPGPTPPAGATSITPAGGSAGEPTIAELIQQITEESSRLLRTELKLAQVEMTEKAKSTGVGLGAFGVAGILALFGIGCLILTAIYALALVLPAWAAALIVGAVVLAIAAVAALIGKKKVSEAGPPVPSSTVENVKADVAEIKGSVRR